MAVPMTNGGRVFSVVNTTFLLLVGAICIFPFAHVAARSLSAEWAILAGRVSIFPVETHLRAYQSILENSGILNSMRFTITLTVLGTITNLALTIMGAYPLSKKRLAGRRALWLFILFTMFFNGGLIPTFLVVRSLGLLDSIWALILPVAVSTFNLIIMKTFFQGIPESLEESARIDGCSDIGILVRIVLPLSLPVMATMILFYSVGHWNQFFLALIYINDPRRYTLQLLLRQIVIQDTVHQSSEGAAFGEILPRESIKSAAIMFAAFPIIMVYPWLQKYFVKGALLGSLKG